MEANGRLQGSNNKCLWPECLVEAAAKHFGGLKAGQAAAKHFGRLKAGGSCRGAFYAFEGWQTAGLNALTTDGSGGKRQA